MRAWLVSREVKRHARRSTASRFKAPIGTYDVLPPESARWSALVSRFADRAARSGFGLALTPVVEHYEVFQRLGESSDVVRKEMYDFEDKGGRHLALRPEGTAGVVRAFAQHHPTVPWKVWYVAPHFRYERPQKGRNRQHYQVGAEVLGVDDPQLDIEVIALAHGFYRDLGLRDVTLRLNSMGDDATPRRVRVSPQRAPAPTGCGSRRRVPRRASTPTRSGSSIPRSTRGRT